jgi:hypothetical protein
MFPLCVYYQRPKKKWGDFCGYGDILVGFAIGSPKKVHSVKYW